MSSTEGLVFGSGVRSCNPTGRPSPDPAALLRFNRAMMMWAQAHGAGAPEGGRLVLRQRPGDDRGPGVAAHEDQQVRRDEPHRGVGAGAEGRQLHQGGGDEEQRGRPQAAPPTGATFNVQADVGMLRDLRKRGNVDRPPAPGL